MAERFDAVVVGAGVIGAAVALELARGGRSVGLVDRSGAVGSGSTSASSAIVRFHYSTRDGVAAAWESACRWLDWEAYLGVRDPAGMASFVRTGALVLDSPGLPTAQTLALFDDLGVPYERFDADQLADRFPALDTGAYGPPVPVTDERFFDAAHGRLTGYLTPDAGYIDDPALAAHNLAHAAVSHGAVLRLRSEVVGVTRDGGRVAGVALADGTALGAPVLVNAAGPWSSRLNAMAGVGADFTMSLRPLRQEVHTVPAPTGFDLGTGAFLTDPDLGVYLRPHAGGTLIVGGMEPDCDPLTWLDDPDEVDGHVTAEAWEAQTLRAARRLPELPVPPRPRGIVGVYDVTDDWIPVYDRTDLPGFYVAIGTSGNQFKNAPLVGELLARLIDAVEAGHDHDADPVQVIGRWSGLPVDLGHYSRLRAAHDDSSRTVMG